LVVCTRMSQNIIMVCAAPAVCKAPHELNEADFMSLRGHLIQEQGPGQTGHSPAADRVASVVEMANLLLPSLSADAAQAMWEQSQSKVQPIIEELVAAAVNVHSPSLARAASFPHLLGNDADTNEKGVQPDSRAAVFQSHLTRIRVATSLEDEYFGMQMRTHHVNMLLQQVLRMVGESVMKDRFTIDTQLPLRIDMGRTSTHTTVDVALTTRLATFPLIHLIACDNTWGQPQRQRHSQTQTRSVRLFGHGLAAACHNRKMSTRPRSS